MGRPGASRRAAGVCPKREEITAQLEPAPGRLKTRSTPATAASTSQAMMA
jgi:hypothetical protein